MEVRPPLMIVTKNHKLFNCSLFPTAKYQLSHIGRETAEIIMYYVHWDYPVKSYAFMIILPRFDYFTLYLSFFSLFMIIIAIILAKKRDIKLKYRQKSWFFELFCEIFS